MMAWKRNLTPNLNMAIVGINSLDFSDPKSPPNRGGFTRALVLVQPWFFTVSYGKRCHLHEET